MTDPIPVLLAADGLPGESDLVAALDAAGGPTLLRRRCLDLADLLGAVVTQNARVAVVDATLRRLDRDALERLHAAGVAIVLVSPQSPSPLAPLVEQVVSVADGDVANRIVEAVVAAVQRSASDQPVSTAAAVDAPAPVLSLAPPAEPTQRAQRGRLVVVWGPHGAPGRTSVALTVADEAARAGLRVWLVDADTTAPSLGQRLALVDDRFGLPQAARQAATGRLNEADLHALGVRLDSGLHVLTGLSRPQRWAEVRPAALRVVVEQLTSIADLVVLDVGAGIERDDEALLDPGLPVRHGAAIAALAMADRVLAVSGPDAISLVRLGRGLEQVTSLAPTASIDVVVNRVRRSVVGLRPEAQVRDVIAGYGAYRTFVVPDDANAWDAALVRGQTLAESAPGCASRKALIEVIDAELPRSARRHAASRRRLLAR